MTDKNADDWRARGLRLMVLRGTYRSKDGGVWDTVGHVTLVGPDLPRTCRIARPAEDAPAVVLSETAPGYPVLRPLDQHGNEVRGMASGAYAIGEPRENWREITGQALPYPLHARTENRTFVPWTGAPDQPVPEPVMTRFHRETDA